MTEIRKLRKAEKRFRRRLWIWTAVLFVIALAISLWWMGPAPPRQIVLATGDPDGFYAAVGSEYQERLGKMGLKVQLHNSQGSVENLKLLLEGKADVALVQAGTYPRVKEWDEHQQLRGLVAIQVEPVWVFYRGETIKDLPDLKKRQKPLSISVGHKDSGTSGLANSILDANGIDAGCATRLNLSMKETHDRLVNNQIDVGFFVSSSRNPTIQKLILDPDVKLVSFTRHLAYTRQFPFLTHVVLGEGVIDLEKNIPGEDVEMFATPTLLVCRQDLHPQTVEQILIAARNIHARPELVTTPQKFPTLEGLDIPVHETAEAYMLSGESLLTRLLPYWGVWLLFKVKILILPLLVVLLPMVRMFPMFYTFRINWLLRQHYAALREVEDLIETADNPETLREQIVTLDGLRKNMENLSRKIPTHLQINVYQWRLHVSHVRSEANERLWRLESQAKETDRGPPEAKITQGG